VKSLDRKAGEKPVEPFYLPAWCVNGAHNENLVLTRSQEQEAGSLNFRTAHGL